MSVATFERFPRPESASNNQFGTISAAISTTARPVSITPSSMTGWPTQPGFRVLIDSELFLITYVGASTWLAETAEGTTAATHLSGASVTQILTAGALSQMILDHGGRNSPTADPHNMYVKKGSAWGSFMSVEDMGIASNTGRDCTSEIQFLIDKLAAAGGGCLTFGTGIWFVRGLVLKFGVSLRGAGMFATVLKMIPAGNAPIITVYTSPDGIIANAELTAVTDMMLHGNRYFQSSPNASGIVAVPNPVYSRATNDYDWDQHHQFSNLFIRDCAGDGVNFVAGRGESRCYNVQVYYCQGTGFILNGDAFLTSCTSGQTGKYGYFSRFQSSIRMTNCKAFYAGRLIDQTEGYFAPIGDYPGFYFGGCNGVALTACEAQDCSAEGYFLEQTNRSTLSSCVADSNSSRTVGAWPGFHLYNCQYTNISAGVAFERRDNGTTSWQQYGLWMEGGGDIACNIDMTFSAISPATVTAPMFPTSVIAKSIVQINGSNVGMQTPTFATTITPDPYSGQYILITQTGNLTIANPTVTGYAGQLLTFILAQDATGGRTITFGSAYKVVWTPSTTASKRNTISFVYDGTSWNQLATAVGI